MTKDEIEDVLNNWKYILHDLCAHHMKLRQLLHENTLSQESIIFKIKKYEEKLKENQTNE